MIPTRRIPQLDFLRGAAILLVLGHHRIAMPAGMLSGVAHFWYMIGWTGVDLFFVLSGYLVGGLLLDELKKKGSIRLGRFLIRRSFKIWPLYYLYLILSTVVRSQRGHETLLETVHNLWPNYLHIQNYFDTPLRHTWSLGVEEHFYISLPLILCLLIYCSPAPRENLRGYLWFAALVVVLCPIARGFAYWRCPEETTYIQWATHFRIDSLIIGVTLAYLVRYIPKVFEVVKRHTRLLVLAGIAAVAPAAFLELNEPYICIIGFSVIALGYACLLVAMVLPLSSSSTAVPRYANVLLAPITFVGVYSYPIYLFHFGMGQFPARLILQRSDFIASDEARWLLVILVNIATVVCLGVFFGKIMERPALALRDRLFPSNSA
jgi:peptidoglycan/LPS O-acetylase OafA/YrhL